MANNKVNSSQCHDYNNNKVYLLQNDHRSEKDYTPHSNPTVTLSVAKKEPPQAMTRGEVCLASFFLLELDAVAPSCWIIYGNEGQA
jgi:hypothetical protein